MVASSAKNLCFRKAIVEPKPRTSHGSRTCLARNVFSKTIRRRYIGQQPRTKSARGPADKPLVNRWLCSPIGLNRNSFVRASRDKPRSVFFDGLQGKREGCLLVEPTRWRPVLPVPAPPRRPAVRRPAPTRPRYVRVSDSTNCKNAEFKYHALFFYSTKQ